MSSTPIRRTTRSSATVQVMSSSPVLKRALPAQDSKRSVKRQRTDKLVSPVAATECIQVESIQTPTKVQTVDIPLPATPASTPTKSTSRSCYAQARSVLRLSSSSKVDDSLPLLGRDEQRAQILSFLSPTSSEFTLRSGGALYISGQPGTGKTALVTDLLERNLPADLPRLFLNCATVKGVQIWETVLDAVHGSSLGLKGLRARKKLEEVVQQESSEPFLLILDEIDHLAHTNLLTSIFALASNANSSLTMIGIANLLDLSAKLPTDNLNMQSLHFPPYKADDMILIARQRLSSLSEDPFTELPLIKEPALRLASQKVAANTGDLRSFLAVIRKAIELAEPTPLPSDLTLNNAPKATPRHVLDALKSCALSSANGNASAKLTSALALAGGLQSRIALTALCIALERSASTKQSEISMESAWSVYNDTLTRAEKSEMIQTRSDWCNLLDNLTVNGLVRESYSKSSPSSKKKSPRKGEKLLGLAFGLSETVQAVRCCVGSAEVSGIACAILDCEKRLQGRKMKVWEMAEVAPSRGFNGNGLEGKEEDMIGVERRGREEDAM